MPSRVVDGVYRPNEPVLLSPRTPIVVRCADCLGRFGEALRESRPCPFCGSVVR